MSLNEFNDGAVTYKVIGDGSVSASLSRVNGFTIPEKAVYRGYIPPLEFKVISVGTLESCNSITIPASFTSIDTISSCSAITIPSSVTSIGKLSTHSYGTLALTLPASVTSISEITGGYKSMGTIVLRMESRTPPFVAKIEDVNKTWQLIVPRGASELYERDPMWGKFKTIREDASLGQDKVSDMQTSASNNAEIAELKRQLAELTKQQKGTGETIVSSKLEEPQIKKESKSQKNVTESIIEAFKNCISIFKKF